MDDLPSPVGVPSAPVGIMWGVGSRLTDADDAMLSFIGYTREELTTGRIDWVAMTPPEFLALDEAGIRQAAETGGFTAPYQKEFIRKDGTRIPVLLVCAFVPEQPGHWMGYVVDLSARPSSGRAVSAPAMGRALDPTDFYRPLIAELVHERTRLRAMLDSTPSPIWSVDRRYRLLAANTAFQEAQRPFSGRDMQAGDDVMGEYFPADTRRIWLDWYERAFAGASVTEIDHVEVQGRVVRHEHRITPLRTPAGHVFGATVVSHNVTEREAAADALRASEQRFRTLAAKSPLGVFLTDAQGRCVYGNTAMEEIFQRPMRELLGLGLLRTVHPDDVASVTIQLRTADTADADSLYEFRIRRPDRTERSVRLWLAPIRDGQRVTGFVGSVEDATDRLRDEQRAAQRDRMESLGTLAGGIAHDFNNMLGIVLSYAELALSEADVPAAVRDELAQIRTASLRARDLVRQILTFSRQSDTAQVSVDLTTMLRETSRLLRASIPAQVALEVAVPDGPVIVRGNPTALQQVVLNLCINAQHAVADRPDPRITIALTSSEGVDPPVARLRVTDNGVGIAPALQRRIFEPFFTTKAPGEGTGMGLAVVHGTVVAHGGQVHVESTAGLGTTFTVELPLATGHALDADGTIPAAPDTGSGSILVVDDEPALRRVLQRALEQAGFRVRTCPDGAEALRALREAPAPIDLILSDVAMPGLTGDRLAREVDRLYPGLPVLLMTGNPANIADRTVGCRNIRAVLQKPLDLAALTRTIAEAIPARTAVT